MKKRILLFASLLATIGASAQGSIPGGNFENWTSATYEYPQYYPTNSNPETFFRYHTPFNVKKTTDAFHGSFALQLETNANSTDTAFGYVANPANGNSSGGPSTWTGGMPITQKPLGIRGHFKYNVASADSALILVIARQGGVSVGMYMYTLGGIHTTYTPFNFTFSPALVSTPDSVIVAFVSSNAMVNSGIPGSILKLDSISFTGITVQPTQMNGDFENWQTQTIESPDNWYSGNNGGVGAIKTVDKVAGNFAVELQTTLGDHDGTPRAQPGNISNGYWDNSCGCMKGGYPFSNQVDTLVFSYKYAPANPNDSASIDITFKNGGSSFMNTGKYLHASATYQLVEIPFNLFSAPDTCIVSIQSSAWGDSATSFVGAVLKVDEIHFKSQPLFTGMNALNFVNDINFYPNPLKTSGTILIGQQINTVGMQVTIYDVTGRVVRKIETNEHKVQIDRDNMENGIYFYELKSKNNIFKTGKFIVE